MIYLKEGNLPLNLAFDDEIIQEANSTYQLSFKFPVIDNKWELLKKETFLLADDLHGEQEFIIIETKKKHGYIQIYANQVATLLNYYSIDTISVSRVAGQTVMSSLAGSIKRTNHPFSFFSDIMDRHTFNMSDISVMDALTKDKHSIVGQWGGDLVRDKYQIKLLKNGGSENESLFMYKKNLSGYEESGSLKSLRTRIHFKKVVKATSESEEDKVFAVTVDSPLINQYSQIYEGNIEVNDQDVTDQESLAEYGRQYFSRTLCDVVEDSITLDVKGQSDVPVKIFDVVSVYHERFNVDMRLKISKYCFTPMAKRLKSIGFGKVNQSFGGAINNAINSAVSNLNDKILDNIELKLQTEIENANRHFDAEFDKHKQQIDDNIEKAKADAEVYADTIRQGISQEFDTFEREYQANKAVQEQQVSDIRAQATDAKTLAQQAQQIGTQAKSDAANALTKALQYKSEAIAEAKRLDIAERQATEGKLATAKSQAIAEAKRLDIAERQATEGKLATAKSQAVAEANRLIELTKSLLAGQIDGVSTELTQTKENIKLLATRDTVDALTGRVSSAEASLQVQAGEIASRVKTSDFDQAKQRLTTAESSITQLGNRITTEISETKGLIPKEFGGVNLLLNSSFEQTATTTAFVVGGQAYDKSAKNWNTYNGGISNPATSYHAYVGDGAERQSVGVFNESNGQRNWKGFSQNITSRIPQTTDNFMFSVDVFATGAGTKIFGGLYYYDKSGTRKFHAGQFNLIVDSFNKWQRVNVKVPFDKFTCDFGKSVLFYVYGYNFTTNSILYIDKLKLEIGEIATAHSVAPEELQDELINAKTLITQTAQGQEQLSTQLTQAQGKITKAETEIRQLIGDVSSKVSQTEYDSLSGRVTSQQTLIEQNASEINKRLTSTQVEQAITGKGYQTKAQVDSNITGRGYITNSALQPYATTTTMQNLVRETSGSFERQITETKALIPTEIGGRNYFLNSDIEITSGYHNVKIHPDFAEHVKGKSFVVSIEVEGTNITSSDRNRWGISLSARRGDTNDRSWLEVWETKLGDTPKKRIYQAFKHQADFNDYIANMYIQIGGNAKAGRPKLEISTLPTDWSPAPEDTMSEIESVKTTITQTAQGQEQLSTQLTQAQGKITKAETEIRQLIGDVSSKVSQTEYDSLSGRVTRQQTLIEQNASEINKRLTSTQVEQAITGKGYQTKAQVDSNITGRGYITNSALQPYATTTTMQNLVRETSGSFERQITETKALIPTEIGGRNYFLNSDIEITSGYHNVKIHPDFAEHVKGKSFVVSIEVEGTNITSSDRNRWGISLSARRGDTNDRSWLEVWETKLGDTPKKRIYQAFKHQADFNDYIANMYIQIGGNAKAGRPKLEISTLPTDWSPAPEDTMSEIESVKTTITQTAQGQEQLSTQLTQAQGKITKAETEIRQLIGDVSSKVSQTEYDSLSGRVTRQQTLIEQNASEINKRLTSTQVEQAITGKGYQTKAQVDSNITGRGYITNSALQPYATTTTMQNLVRETSGSFERQITETKALIPTEIGGRNYFLNSDIEITSGYHNVKIHPDFAEHVKGKSFVVSIEVEGTNITSSDRNRWGISLSARRGDTNDRSWLEVWETKLGDTPKKRIYQAFKHQADFNDYIANMYIQIGGNAKAGRPKLEISTLPTDWSPAPEDTMSEIESVKTTITQTAQGQEQLSTQLTQAQGKITKAETEIRQLIGDVSSKVSQTEYDSLSGRVTSQQTLIEQNASEINKRLTSTQVEQAITGKGYQTKAQVDSNITGRGYITSSALQPYVTSTVLENKVTETAGSFERSITETKALIPTSTSVNLVDGTKDFSGSHFWIDGNWRLDGRTVAGADVLTWQSGNKASPTLTWQVEAGKEYIFSAYVAKETTGTVYFYLYNFGGDDITSTTRRNHHIDDVGTDFKRFTLHFVPTRSGKIRARFAILASDVGGFSVAGYQLLEGRLEQPWSPSVKELSVVTAFNTVKDTVDAHKRVIGDGSAISQAIQSASKFERSIVAGGDIYQAIETAKGLVSRVSSLSDGQNLVYDPTNFSKYKARTSNSTLALTGTSSYKLLRITQTGLSSPKWKGFQVPLHTQSFTAGEKLSYRVNLWVDVLPDDIVGIEIKNGTDKIAVFPIRLTQTGSSQIFTGTVTVSKTTTTTDDYGLHVWIRKNGTVAIGQISIVRGDVPPTSFVDSTSAMQLAAETQMSQLAGSWAVKNLTSAGTVLNQLNLNKDGSVKIDGKLVQITGTTYIQDGVITSAKIASLDAAKITAGTLDASRVNVINLNASKIVGLDANFIKAKIETAMIDWMKGKVITAKNEAMQINLNEANITFKANASIAFNSVYNTIHRTRGANTGFLKIEDSTGGGVNVIVGATSGNASQTIDTARFAGIVANRDNDMSDYVEIYGDYIYFKHAKNSKKMVFQAAAMTRDYNLLGILDKLIHNMNKLHRAGAFGRETHFTDDVSGVGFFD